MAALALARPARAATNCAGWRQPRVGELVHTVNVAIQRVRHHGMARGDVGEVLGAVAVTEVHPGEDDAPRRRHNDARERSGWMGAIGKVHPDRHIHGRHILPPGGADLEDANAGPDDLSRVAFRERGRAGRCRDDGLRYDWWRNSLVPRGVRLVSAIQPQHHAQDNHGEHEGTP